MSELLATCRPAGPPSPSRRHLRGARGTVARHRGGDNDDDDDDDDDDDSPVARHRGKDNNDDDDDDDSPVARHRGGEPLLQLGPKE